MEKVLFAVLGTSPSVLTETIWALAQASPPLIPDRVVVLTTTVGQQKLIHDLFTPPTPAWQRLIAALTRQGLPVAGKLCFGPAQAHINLIPYADGSGNLTDVTSYDDNTAAANFIMRQLRAETENPHTQVLASIAGGRKTMSALLMSCMSLLGRAQDRVLHVLVNPPFDGPLDPPFIFPEEQLKHQLRDGTHVLSSTAQIELIDVPFVRMRGWYEGAFKKMPPSYATLVANVQQKAPPAINAPKLTLDSKTGLLAVANGTTIRLSPTEFAALWLLWHEESKIAKTLHQLRQRSPCAMAPEWRQAFHAGSRFADEKVLKEDLSKCLSSARAKIKTHEILAPFAEMLLPKRGKPLQYPRTKIKYSGFNPFADIRRHTDSP